MESWKAIVKLFVTNSSMGITGGWELRDHQRHGLSVIRWVSSGDTCEQDGDSGYTTADPWTRQGLGYQPPRNTHTHTHTIENPHTTFDSPKSEVQIASDGPGNLIGISWLTCILYVMCIPTYILCIYNMPNLFIFFSVLPGYMFCLQVFSNCRKSPKHFPVYLSKKSMLKWPHTVQPHVVQESTVIYCIPEVFKSVDIKCLHQK